MDPAQKDDATMSTTTTTLTASALADAVTTVDYRLAPSAIDHLDGGDKSIDACDIFADALLEVFPNASVTVRAASADESHGTARGEIDGEDFALAVRGVRVDIGTGADVASDADRDLSGLLRAAWERAVKAAHKLGTFDWSAPLEACAYCGAEHAPSSSVPALDDDAAWDELADHHDPHCEWVLTRAHRFDSVVKVDQEYGPDAWWQRARATVSTQTPAVSALFARIEEREEAYCRAQDAEALVQWAETLPAWHDGPEYAPNPLIVRSVKD